MRLIFVSLLILCIYSDNKIYSGNSVQSIYRNITNIEWQIESIVKKKGTKDPDEIVPANQVTIIDTGKIIKGVICFRNNKKITIKDSDP